MNKKHNSIKKQTRKRTPLFSIITINLNNASGLEKTIKSVLAQKYKNYEFIIIDGKSTDNSVEVIKQYEDQITSWISEKDKNIYDAMNKGIKKAKGKYLLFLHTDDYFYNNNVLKRVAGYKLNKLVYFGNLLVDNNDGGDLFRVNFGKVNPSLEFFLEYALPHQATFFHKNVFKKNGLYDDKYYISSDHEYFIRLFKNKEKFHYIPEDISIYDGIGISSNPKNKKIIMKEKASIFDKHFGYPTIHFLTIVLNGEPFIRYHIDIFKSLPFKWHWHIVEGVANLTHDTAWSLPNGGTIPEGFHNHGRSIDGTEEYVNRLKKKYPHNITVYRKPKGQFWDGKKEMVEAPLKNIKERCLLWQVDSDEYWTKNQIIRLRELFMLYPKKTAAYFLCHFFVGDKLMLKNFDQFGNTLSQEWLRVWCYNPGDKWVSHEPPRLSRLINSEWVDVAKINPFLHIETESCGLIFQHFAYVMQKQLDFKEKYYGLHGVTENWKKLNKQKKFPVFLKHYFNWVKDNSEVVTAKSQNVYPLLIKKTKGKWVNIKAKQDILPPLDNTRYLLTEKIAEEKYELQQTINVNTNQIEEIRNSLFKKEEDIEKILSSRSWKFATLTKRIADKIIPPGSLGRKVFKGLYSFTKKTYQLFKRVSGIS